MRISGANRVIVLGVDGLDPNILEKLIRTRYNITREQKKGLKEAIGNVLRDVALPLGIDIATNLGK